MATKKFKLNVEEIIDLIKPMGCCIASDKITVEGMKVGFMYRERPEDNMDSGWRFFSGTEDEDYVDDISNAMMFDVNVIANYDNDIIPYLNMPVGTELERIEDTNEFQSI